VRSRTIAEPEAGVQTPWLVIRCRKRAPHHDQQGTIRVARCTFRAPPH
jgi:hypothetical protein